MLGGSNCKVGGKSNSGGSSCGSRVSGGAKKKIARKRVARKGVARKGVVRKGGGTNCNYANYETAFEINDLEVAPGSVPVQAPASVMTGDGIVGGAKKIKSKKTGKSRKAGPYAKFVKKHFASVQKKNPKFKATDCIKELAKMWKEQKK